MNSYPTYKDSGVEWIGEIPSSWDIKRNKYITTPKKKKSEDGNEELLSVSEYLGVVPRSVIRKGEDHLTRSESLEGYLKVSKGDLVNNIMLMWKKGLGVSKYDGIVSPSYSVFRFNNSIPTYHHYLFRTELYITEFRKNSTGVILSRLRLYDDDFGDIYSYLPPLLEQSQIVSFLDTKTQKIDDLIQKTEKKIELLKEKRTSLINHCVTKGLNPNVEMKDSGVEWIGEIPSGWDVKNLKYISDVYSSSVDRHIYKEEIQVSICHYPDVYNNEFINDKIELNKGSCSEVEFQRYILKKGLVILTKDSETPDDIGNPCYVEDDFDNVVCGYHLTIIEKNDDNVNSKFLFRFIQSDKVRCHFETESRGITRFSLGKSKIENLFVTLPSYTEQTQIVEYLDEQTQKIDTTIEKETQRIELLKEYRQSLISEVVTGKVDVRGWTE